MISAVSESNVSHHHQAICGHARCRCYFAPEVAEILYTARSSPTKGMNRFITEHDVSRYR